MNRIVITLDGDGGIAAVCADQPVQVFFNSPHTPGDRVYLYGSVNIGAQHVQDAIGGHPVGHSNDWDEGAKPGRCGALPRRWGCAEDNSAEARGKAFPHKEMDRRPKSKYDFKVTS